MTDDVRGKRRAPRGVLAKLLKRYTSGDFYRNTVLAADDYVDEALTQLEDEEPYLLRWLDDDPEVLRLLRAHTAAVYAALSEADKHRHDIERVVRALDALAYRTLATVAVGAIRRERTRQVWEPWPEEGATDAR